MNLLLTLAQTAPATPAAAPGGPAGFFGSQIFPFILIFVLMYFLLIRPQLKRQKEQKKLQESLQVGDKVVTIGGAHGKVAEVGERTVTLRFADNQRIEFDKAAVSTVVRKETAKEN